MRALVFIILSISIIFVSCKEDDTVVDTTSSAPYDPFADITFLGNGFYTTNYNTSMKAGPQVFLYRVSADGKVAENRFDLSMNGQGYLAITSDSINLYLQSRNFNSVIKCSPVGEVFYNDLFIRPTQWQGCGIGYVSSVDSLCVLTRDMQNLNNYELLFVNKDNPNNWRVKASASILGLSLTTGAYAIEVRGNDLYILGQDTTDTDVLVKTNLSLDTLEYTSLNTDSTTGFCYKGNDIFFSHLNRKIEQRSP
jgi:hypothetical protein